MSWARLDDGISDHPKIWKAGPFAELCHYRALIWSNRNSTDGELPGALLSTLCRGFEDRAEEVAMTLVRVNLWELRGNGTYVIHDFNTSGLNTPRAEVLAKREQISRRRAEAGAKGAQARWHPRVVDDSQRPASGPDREKIPF